MKNIKLILTTAVLALFTSCANDDHYGAPDLSGICKELTPTTEVQTVFSVATNTMQQYTSDDVIEAYVTSSDMGGNFYKSISFVSMDNTRGFSMPVDDYNLYTKFPPGQKVYIKLDSLYIQNRTSQTRGLQIGTAYQGNVGRIASILYRDMIIPACEGSVNEDELVHTLTIQQAKNDSHLNKLIEFEGVQFTNESLGHNYFSSAMNPFPSWTATDHKIEDANGNDIIVRISKYSNFASNPVAVGSGKIRGVMTRYGSTWQFMVRDERDIKLDAPRMGEEPVEPEEPEEPQDPTSLFFNGSDFENWTTFNSSLSNSFPPALKPYAVQGVGMGINGGASLHLNGTPTANDYVFTVLASAQGDIPANPTKITFWVKGTSAKSLSLNVYRSTAGTAYDVFNVANLGTSAVTLNKAEINSSSGNGTNSYTGTINTNGQWVKVTLNISDVNLNTTTTGNLFALKVGSNSAYDLHIDNIEIE